MLRGDAWLAGGFSDRTRLGRPPNHLTMIFWTDTIDTIQRWVHEQVLFLTETGSMQPWSNGPIDKPNQCKNETPSCSSFQHHEFLWQGSIVTIPPCIHNKENRSENGQRWVLVSGPLAFLRRCCCVRRRRGICCVRRRRRF